MAPPPHLQTESGSSEAAAAAVTAVDVATARELLIGGRHRYLDVRTEEELAKLGHLVEAGGGGGSSPLNVPYMFITPLGSRVKNAEFVEQVASLLSSKEEHLVVGCQSGKRSELACIDLQAAGFSNVKNLEGGYLAWLQHGFPVHHHPPASSPPPPETTAAAGTHQA